MPLGRAWLWVALAAVLAPVSAGAQPLSQRGFAEAHLVLYPQSVPVDPAFAVGDVLFRYEPAWRAASWLRVTGGVDARLDTDSRVDRTWSLDWWDRGFQRQALGVRRLSLVATRGWFSVEVGKQFIRWGKADILNPTDRFAPRDFLTVLDNDFLAVTGGRAIFEGRADTLDVVWVPRFTPSRIPLADRRWTVFPASFRLAIAAGGFPAEYPARAQAGLRWSHLGRGYEFALAFYDGFDNLPSIRAAPGNAPGAVTLTRIYPRMRMYGGDAAVPLRWFTLKGETGYFTSATPDIDEYGLYVVQLERQVGEWHLVGGYAGEFTIRRGTLPRFAPDLGLARAVLGRAALTIDAARTLTFEAAVRRNGAGSWVKGEYSQARGNHWRTTLEANWIRGRTDDFLGQYRRNSNLNLALRYSF